MRDRGRCSFLRAYLAARNGLMPCRCNRFPGPRKRLAFAVMLSSVAAVSLITWFVATGAVAQTSSVEPTESLRQVRFPLTPVNFLKLLVVPIFLWFIRGIIANAVSRYHLIRNLRVEIENNFAWYDDALSRFDLWKAENAENKPVLNIDRITWNIPIYTKVYDSAQKDIRSTLWGKEVINIHRIYSVFIHLDRRFSVLAEEIDRAKAERIEYVSGRAKWKDLSESDREDLEAAGTNTQTRNSQIITTTVERISILLNKITHYQTGARCAADQFYGKRVYTMHLMGVGVLIIMMVEVLALI